MIKWGKGSSDQQVQTANKMSLNLTKNCEIFDIEFLAYSCSCGLEWQSSSFWLMWKCSSMFSGDYHLAMFKEIGSKTSEYMPMFNFFYPFSKAAVISSVYINGSFSEAGGHRVGSMLCKWSKSRKCTCLLTYSKQEFCRANLLLLLLHSPATSLGFTIFGWDFCVCDRFLSYH